MDDIAAAVEGEAGSGGAAADIGRLISLKDSDTFLVADAWGDVAGAPTACSAATRASCRASCC